jgi:hypothetical protein
MKKAGKKGTPPPVYIVSGGSGASGQQIVETVLAQFPTTQLPVIVRNYVRNLKQVESAVKEAKADGGTVVHTLVEGGLREALIRHGRQHGVATIDLMGPLLEQVGGRPARNPSSSPACTGSFARTTSTGSRRSISPCTTMTGAGPTAFPPPTPSSSASRGAERPP